MNTLNKVTVLGSLNVDTSFRVTDFPKPGETISVKEKGNAAGGKGANQAVAASRLGAQTSFIGQVGDDASGRFMVKSLEEDNIDASCVSINPSVGTGTATIMLDEDGQNCILVYGGANQAITPEDIEGAEDEIASSDFLVAQFETPQNVAIRAFEIAKANGVKTILNPAPAPKSIDPELLKLTDIIVPNELESASITGIEITDEESMVKTAACFAEMGVANVLITVGDRGAFYMIDGKHNLVPAYKVQAVDTTAAGDTFIGALSAQLKTDYSNVEEAISFAEHASSITVQRLGAQPSIPHLDEVKELINN